MATKASEQALAEINQLETTKKQIVDRMPTSSTGPESKKLLNELQTEVKQIDAKVAQLQQTTELAVAPSDLVQSKSAGKAGSKSAGKAGNKSGKGNGLMLWFVDTYGYLNFPIIDKETPDIKTNLPLVTVKAAFELILTVGFSITNSQLIEGTGSLTAKMGIELNLGVNEGVRKFRIQAQIGIRGNIQSKVDAKCLLKPKGNTLAGYHEPVVFDFAISSSLIIKLSVPNFVLRAIVTFLRYQDNRWSLRENTLEFEFGRLSIVETRTGQGSFVVQGQSKLTYRRSGSMRSGISPQLERLYYDMVLSIKRGVDHAMSKADPTKWNFSPWW